MSGLPVNHVFIDFENVPEFDLAEFGERVVKVTVLLGGKHKRLATELVERLLAHAGHLQFVRLTSSGKNALDFTLTYYLGRAVAGDPTGYFHVISKDKGFDPMIEHLQRQQVKVQRHDNLATLAARLAPRPIAPAPVPPAKSFPTRRAPAAMTPSIADGTDDVWAHLVKSPAHRPKRREKLRAVLRNKFHFAESQLDATLAALVELGLLIIDENEAITYRL